MYFSVGPQAAIAAKLASIFDSGVRTLYGDSFWRGLSMLKTLTKTDSRYEAIAVTTRPSERKLTTSTLVLRGICRLKRIKIGTTETNASVMIVTLMVP